MRLTNRAKESLTELAKESRQTGPVDEHADVASGRGDPSGDRARYRTAVMD